MARQNVNRGTIANDGTGDTLRTAAKKINDNFVELYLSVGGDSDVVTSKVTFVEAGLSFEGSIDDDHETILGVTNPTGDRTVTIPDASGNVVLDTATQTLTNKTITSPVLTSIQINDTSADHQYIVVPSELAADRNVTLPLLGDNDEFTFNGHTQTLTNKTIDGGMLVNNMVGGKNLGGNLLDSSGGELLEFDRVASAVNHVKMSNTATGNSPKIEAVGTDADVSLNLAAKGTGGVDINSKLVYNAETVVSSVAVSLAVPLTIFNASSGTIVPTLGDGEQIGEEHRFVGKGGATVHLTGNNNIAGADSNGSFFNFGVNSTLSLLWDGAIWQVMSSLDGAEGNPISLV